MSQRSQRQPPRDDTSRSVFLVFETNDIYQNVVEYLNPEDLRNFTLSYTSMRDSPLLTTSIVIKNTLLNGNKHTKTRIERIYAQILSNTIFIPTPIRLLSLLTMKHCEFCHTRLVNFISDYGLALCLPCKKEHTTCIETKPAKLLKTKIEMNDIIQHQDVNLFPHHFIYKEPYYNRRFAKPLPVYYVLNKPFYDKNNDRVGPIITNIELNEMLHLQSYQAVEKYIETNKPEQSQARCMFIQAMTIHREKCFEVIENKEKEHISKVKMYRFKKYLNTTQAIAFLLERIPDHLKYKLDYNVRPSFPCPPEVTYGQLVALRRRDDHYLLLTSVDDVRKILSDGPPNAQVRIHIIDRVVARIIKPLLDSPTKFNDETKRKHRNNLHHLAQTICRYYGAREDSDFPATW